MTNESKISIWVSCLLYRLLMEKIYVDFLAQPWAFYGFKCEMPSMNLYMLTWGMYIVFIPLVIVLLNEACFTSFVLACLIFFAYFPSITMYTYHRVNFMPEYFTYWLFVFIFYLLSKPKLNYSLQLGSSEEKFINTISRLCIFLSLYVWGKYARFHIQTSLLDVYELRSLASRWHMLFITRYMYASMQFIMPFLMIVAVDRKHYSLAGIIFTAQIINFFAQGSKSSVFGLVISLLVYFYFNSKQGLKKLPFAAMILALLALGECILTHSRTILNVFFRRALFIPALLNVYYYDYFSHNTPDFYMGNFMRFLGFSSKYTVKYGSISNLIGAEYFHRPSMYANNGLFSEAYSELGLLGIVVQPFFLVLILRVFDRCMGDSEKTGIIAGASVMMIFSFIGSLLSTNLFSHGFILVMIAFCFLKKKEHVCRLRFIAKGRKK